MSRKNTKSEQAAESKAPAYIAFHVRDGEEKGKGFWTRIGAAWKHKDGEGLSLQLDLVPLDGGRIVLRTPKEDEADESKSAEQGA
ncbi:MAG: hypothetical protein J0H65_13740 [Rhizobiales bacterium]|nr:hypothetical protein [Hyphomicrobiales bacterium]